MIDDSAVYGFLDEYELRCGITERYIDLSSEVGELGKELLKATDYGKVDFRMTADTEQELGDCLFSLIALSRELGIDPAAALDSTLAKYKRRFDAKGRIGSEDNRKSIQRRQLCDLLIRHGTEAFRWA